LTDLSVASVEWFPTFAERFVASANRFLVSPNRIGALEKDCGVPEKECVVPRISSLKVRDRWFALQYRSEHKRERIHGAEREGISRNRRELQDQKGSLAS